jgi:hypothetical protein
MTPMENPPTTVVISQWGKTYSIEFPGSDTTLCDLISEGIIPVLRAVGYGQETINDYFYPEDEEE